MADVLMQGYHVARDAGLLQDDAPIWFAIAMDGTVPDADSIFVDDTDLVTTEYDGAGYDRHEAAGVTWAYDSSDDEMQLDCDDDPEAFGDTVVAASDPPAGVYTILQAGGSPDDSADYVLGYNDSGSYGNGGGGALGLTVPVGGFLYSKQG